VITTETQPKPNSDAKKPPLKKRAVFAKNNRVY